MDMCPPKLLAQPRRRHVRTAQPLLRRLSVRHSRLNLPVQPAEGSGVEMQVPAVGARIQTVLVRLMILLVVRPKAANGAPILQVPAAGVPRADQVAR